MREARRTISAVLASGKTATIGHRYGEVRGFIVGVPQHNTWNLAEKRKALKAAHAAFSAAWKKEAKQE